MEHKDIPDNQRHEPRGATTATSGQSLFANGDGTTSFRFIQPEDITGLALTGYTPVLAAYSTAVSQNPSAVDTPLQIEFGTAQDNENVSLAADGTLTFNQTGQYLLTLFLRFGRTTGAGTSILLNRLVYNGVQYLRTNAIALSDAAATVPFSATLVFQATAGDTLKLEIARDSTGINNGGVFRTVPTTLAWNISPSASVVVHKLGP